jgi:hypothetical protein
VKEGCIGGASSIKREELRVADDRIRAEDSGPPPNRTSTLRPRAAAQPPTTSRTQMADKGRKHHRGGHHRQGDKVRVDLRRNRQARLAAKT